jgi:hypothetical protein
MAYRVAGFFPQNITDFRSVRKGKTMLVAYAVYDRSELFSVDSFYTEMRQIPYVD